VWDVALFDMIRVAETEPNACNHGDFRYDKAELCAQRALVLDPKFMKARYRRGLARKGNLEFARAAVGKSLLCFTRDVCAERRG